MSIDGMIPREKDGLRFYTWRVFEPWSQSMTAMMTTKAGSSPPLEMLNMSHQAANKPEHLHKNQQVLAAALNEKNAEWVFANQVHSNKIADVDDRRKTLCDGLYLRTPKVIAAILLADCLPVLVYDPVNHTGIVAHAGWRGTVKGIAQKAVAKMILEGSRLENLVGATGPGIGPCCYEVGQEVVQEFALSFGNLDKILARRSEKSFIDLEQANIALLRAAGIQEERMGRAGFCTACRREEFFSYRKDGDTTGRHAALMVHHG